MVRHGVEISRIGGSRVVLQDEFVRSCNRRRERSWRMMGERKKDVDPEHFREMGILGALGPKRVQRFFSLDSAVSSTKPRLNRSCISSRAPMARRRLGYNPIGHISRPRSRSAIGTNGVCSKVLLDDPFRASLPDQNTLFSK